MNDTLSDLIDSRGGILSEADLRTVESEFGHHARIQAARMTRQMERFKAFEASVQPETRSSEPAEDATLIGVLAKTKPPPVTTYLLKLPELVADAKARGIGVHGIDGCLWLLALSEKGLANLVPGL